MLRTAPDMRDRFEGRLCHATTREAAERLLRDGFEARRSYWGIGEVTEYYLEVVEDDGEEAVVLSVALSDLDERHLVPDMPGIEEPLTHVLGTSEDLVIEAWGACAGTWRDSLDLIGSVAYDGRIPGRMLRVD